jgi:LemA protein
MPTWLIVLIAVLGSLVLLAVICLGWWISCNNKFKRYQVEIQEAESDIDVALTKRYDLLTKMFDITKGYAKHEKETLAEVIGLREGIPAGTDVKGLSGINSKLDAEAKKIDLAFEKYPDLKANTVFLELQAGSRDAEEHLQAARRMYNSNVKSYNELLVVFPSSIVASHYKYQKADFFEAEDAKRSDVKMDF